MTYGAIFGILALFAGAGLVIYALREGKKSGRIEKEHEAQEQVIENVKKANDAAADSSHDDKLREKYRK